MGGGLMQLVAYGSQDVYLTGSPQITFWKVVYRRHTNFAIESVKQTFSGATGFGKSVVATISRNGDLVHKCYLQVKLPAISYAGQDTDADNYGDQYVSYCNAIGHALIKSVELEIGGQTIDKQYGEWMEIIDELTTPAEKQDGYWEMIGKYETNAALEDNHVERTLYIPLQFYFCTNPGLALPLIALQYHEIRLKFEFEQIRKLLVTEPPASELDATQEQKITTRLGSNMPDMIDCALYVDYVYLDTDERRRMAQSSHEFLITQLQFNGGDGVNAKMMKSKLNFNHPVKELVWVVQRSYHKSLNDHFNFSASNDAGMDPIQSAKLTLNGHDRFDEREGVYFRLVQPYQHHTRVPKKQIYVYSFALKPEEAQPSGSCNFSRIDNAQLQVGLTDLSYNHMTASGNDENGDSLASESADPTTLKIYATNWNVFRVMSGMGGLAYSN